MSEIKVSKLTNRAGTGAPDFSQGLKISGTTSTLLAPARTESATEPTSPSNGDTWYDTANDTYDIYINDEWKRFIGASGAVSWTVNLSDVSYDSVSFSVSAKELTPYCLAFNNDGTKMYVGGNTSDSAHEYSLSTAWDISTASFSTTFSLGTQDSTPRNITFNNDGTKMYMVGDANNSIYQYSLSTAFDLSTASYDSVSFSVVSQDGSPFGMAFNNDGTKMYMVGFANDKVYQYSLSTAFDLSTTSYDSVSFSVTQDATPSEVAFNTDGTKMYILGYNNDYIYQYSLSTAFDLSTASYDSVSVDVGTPTGELYPSGMVFSSDGTKVYIVGFGTDNVYQFSTGL